MQHRPRAWSRTRASYHSESSYIDGIYFRASGTDKKHIPRWPQFALDAIICNARGTAPICASLQMRHGNCCMRRTRKRAFPMGLPVLWNKFNCWTMHGLPYSFTTSDYRVPAVNILCGLMPLTVPLCETDSFHFN